MEKQVRIVWLGAQKKGVSQRNGEEWVLTDVDIEWTVAQPGRESYNQSCNGTVKGWINRELVESMIRDKKEILVTMYTRVRTWNDKHFTAVDIFLPINLMLDAEPL